MTPSRTCFSENGLIMSRSSDILRIQRSLFSMKLPLGIASLGDCVIKRLKRMRAKMRDLFGSKKRSRFARLLRSFPASGQKRPLQEDNPPFHAQSFGWGCWLVYGIGAPVDNLTYLP